MTKHLTGSRSSIGPANRACLHGIKDRGGRAGSGLGSPHRPPHRLRRQRVDLARQRLAAGRYDSEELLDTVLDLVIADLSA